MSERGAEMEEQLVRTAHCSGAFSRRAWMSSSAPCWHVANVCPHTATEPERRPSAAAASYASFGESARPELGTLALRAERRAAVRSRRERCGP